MLYGQYIVYAESEFFRIFRLILSEVKGKGKLYFLKRMQTHGIISTGLMPAPSEASVHRKAYHVDRHGIISADIIPAPSEASVHREAYHVDRYGIISTAPSEASVHREAYHVDRHGILITNKHIADILRAAAAEDTSALC